MRPGNMRILWICGSRVIGGAERVNLRLTGLLRARGHVVEVLCPGNGDFAEAASAEGLACHHGPLGSSVDLRAIFKIRTVSARGFDAVLVTTTDEWVWASLAASRRGPRLILARYMALPLPRAVLWLARHRADGIVAISDAVRETLLGAGTLDPRRVWTIPHPLSIEPRLCPPDCNERRAARVALGLPEDGRWIGFFGGFSEGKGIGDLVEAARIAAADVGRLNVLVTDRDRSGSGNLGRWADSLGDRGTLHLMGGLKYELMATAMTAVDAVVVATRSTVKEASSLVLHEALATGTPGVAYATGGIPELFGGDGVAGLLAEPDDPCALAAAITRVFLDKDLATRVAEAGIRRVRERCDDDRIATAYERVFGGSTP